MAPTKKQRQEVSPHAVLSPQEHLPGDVVGVIAGFLPATTEHQQPLMLVCHSWYRGVVEQDGMAPKPGIRWPVGALRMRGSRLVLPADHDERCFQQLAEQYPDVEHISVPYTTKVSAGGFVSLSQLEQLKLNRTSCFTTNGVFSRLVQRQDLTFVEQPPTTDPMQFNANTDPQAIPVDMLPKFVEMLKSDDDPQKQLHGTIMIRKLISLGTTTAQTRGSPICLTEVEEDTATAAAPEYLDDLIQQLRRDEMPELQFQAAWILSNMATDAKMAKWILDVSGSLEALMHLLTSEDERCCEQAAWCLGNIAGNGPRWRNRVLEAGAGPALADTIHRRAAAVDTKRTLVWAMATLCSIKPSPELETVWNFMESAPALLHATDDVIIAMAAWGFSFVCDGAYVRIQKVVDCGCLRTAVELLRSPKLELVTPALSIIGNCVTGNETQTQTVLDSGALGALGNLLEHPCVDIRKNTLWALSNITAGNTAQIGAVLMANLLPSLLKATTDEKFEVRKEAMWCIANATICATAAQIATMVAAGTLEFAFELLTKVGEPRAILSVALETIANILESGETSDATDPEEEEEGKEVKDVKNPYALRLIEGGYMGTLRALLEHENTTIVNETQVISTSYFPETIIKQPSER